MLPNFNSIKVRLEQGSTAKTKAQIANFNSIKVRLEQNAVPGNATITVFQFHKGTIRTILCLL